MRKPSPPPAPSGMNAPALDFVGLRGNAGSRPAVRRYVQARSLGYCEACGFAARLHPLMAGAPDDPEPVLVGHDASHRRSPGPEGFAAAVGACAAALQGQSNVIGRTVVARRVARVEEALEGRRLLVVTAAVIEDDRGLVLVARRTGVGARCSKWEFPGGKAEGSETLTECLARELREELAVEVGPIEPFFMVDHRYDDLDVRLCALRTSLVRKPRKLTAHSEVRWVERAELSRLDLAGADVELAAAVTGALEPSGSSFLRYAWLGR